MNDLTESERDLIVVIRENIPEVITTMGYIGGKVLYLREKGEGYFDRIEAERLRAFCDVLECAFFGKTLD
ncbi:hypothetical protein EEL32_11330 [Brevibacillus laterosporus]|nr:hypothetical protein [Brevibacillus laterosporus]RAP17738.1 hypothetical protein C2W64_04559 [Brevibacillus laterosporus]TPG87790.1 hypothetical protein EEL32_11330 [Brevibacillus laterosporus]